MSGHDERLRKDPANIVEMLIDLLDQAESMGAQVITKIELAGSPTLILGAQPSDFDPDERDL